MPSTLLITRASRRGKQTVLHVDEKRNYSNLLLLFFYVLSSITLPAVSYRYSSYLLQGVHDC